MQVQAFPIEGPLLITPARFGDDRGYFSETFRSDWLDSCAMDARFVQDNHSFSARRGTLRGLHCQLPPQAQGKLVRVARGAVLDVIVDARRASPTFGKHLQVELSAENWRQLWVPPGFLHGFCTLRDDTEFLYKVTSYFSPEHDWSVAWNDPQLGIQWPDSVGDYLLSEKDRAALPFEALPAFS